MQPRTLYSDIIKIISSRKVEYISIYQRSQNVYIPLTISREFLEIYSTIVREETKKKDIRSKKQEIQKPCKGESSG